MTEQPPCGTIILLPWQRDAPLFGRRVKVLRRQRDVLPGKAVVRCQLVDGPVRGWDDCGIAVTEVAWDDPAAMASWLEHHPEPAPARRPGRSRKANDEVIQGNSPTHRQSSPR